MTLRALLLIFSGILSLHSGLIGQDRPNIIFIFTDDHCEQALSAYDPSRMSTPSMDRLANEGMRFSRC